MIKQIYLFPHKMPAILSQSLSENSSFCVLEMYKLNAIYSDIRLSLHCLLFNIWLWVSFGYVLCLLTHSLALSVSVSVHVCVCMCTSVERCVNVYMPVFVYGVYAVGLSGIRTSVCVAFVGVCERVVHTNHVYCIHYTYTDDGMTTVFTCVLCIKRRFYSNCSIYQCIPRRVKIRTTGVSFVMLKQSNERPEIGISIH